MPTARGWAVAGTGVALWVAGMIFGAKPLGQLGVGLCILVGIGAGVVRSGRHEVAVQRTVSPERVQAGREVEVNLVLSNHGRSSTPLLLVEDSSLGSGRARFALEGIDPGTSRTVTYTTRPPRRGRYKLGPAHVTISDPFGVARRRTAAAGNTAFLVYPKTEPLTLPKDAGMRKSTNSSAHRNPTGSQGEDFYTLREYVEGDDLRRIQWSATAKRDRLMLRQEETSWHARATVLVDDRASAHSPATWERSIEVAASALDLYQRAGYAFNLVLAQGTPQRFGRGPAHLHRCLDTLAIAEICPADEKAPDPVTMRLAELESKASVEGVLIVVTGTPSGETTHALSRCGRRFRLVVCVAVLPELYEAGTDPAAPTSISPPMLARAGVKTLVLGPQERLGPAWSALWKASGTTAPVQGVAGGV